MTLRRSHKHHSRATHPNFHATRRLADTLSECLQFEPEASSIRINCFWFLSLIFSLTSALCGLLCKRWLREQQQDPPTTTPAEALGLRQMRRDSFQKWGVSSFLPVLPILLDVALLLFFVGVLDILWSRHPIPFVFCFVAGLISAGLSLHSSRYWPTSSWSRLSSSSSSLTISYVHYKLAVCRLSLKALRGLKKISLIDSCIMEWFGNFMDPMRNPALDSSDRSSFDLGMITEFSIPLDVYYYLNVYELRAFQRVFTTLQDSPSMLPHFRMS
ncbi:hypothetical protein Moror_4396 [Moniliophthora roreri MCA 2997]|uniref:DUF6535 domain-containing protein n=1 Tax=Moniliophthora roreri (strain MCA 2997) TaxID=1381753 RepID=V2XFV1_MONRO|nr:hypothetical protein Moror_4396 [Moniliophthora roreri MCA 2997]